MKSIAELVSMVRKKEKKVLKHRHPDNLRRRRKEKADREYVEAIEALRAE